MTTKIIENQTNNSKNVLYVIRVNNPFDPAENTLEHIDWEKGKSLKEYFPLETENPLDYHLAVNGSVIDFQEYDLTYPSSESGIVIAPQIHGGDSKSIFRIVALVAIVALSGYAGGIVGAKFGVLAGSLTSAGITIAGTLVVNALLPPVLPSNDLGGNLQDSRTFGIDGPKNSSTEGISVPVCYGGYRMAGNILQLFTVNEGTTQILHLLVNAGEGPIAGISEVKLNDQPIENFEDYEVATRDGLFNQSVIPWFNDQISPVNIGVTIDTNYVIRNTIGEVDKLRFDFVCPEGLFKVDEKGRLKNTTVDLIIQYRLVGTTPWLDAVVTDTVVSYVDNYHYFETDLGLARDEPDLDSGHILIGDTIWTTSPITGGRQVGIRQKIPVYSDGTVSVTDNRRSAVRVSFSTPLLPQGFYETRVKRVIAESQATDVFDRIDWSDLNEIVTDNVAYRYTALIGLKIKLSDQLSSIPTLTYYNGGRLVDTWDHDTNSFIKTPSANPAWVALDMLTSTRYGGGISVDKIDLIKWIEWADFCDANNLTFKSVFDTTQNVWDSSEPVFRAGHARRINIGTRYSVAIERAEKISGMFSVANILSGTFENNWTSLSDRANAVELQYFPPENDYKQKTIKIYDENRAPNDAERIANVTMIGVTDHDTAVNEARLILNMNRYLIQTVQFEAPLEAIGVTIGSVVYIQHDQPQWGYAGRLEAGSTSSVIKLDRTVEMTTGNVYKLLLLISAQETATGNVQSIFGTTLRLSGYDGTDKVDRISINGEDREVVNYSTNNGGEVTLRDVTGISVSDLYSLYETDSVQERNVQVQEGEFDTITVSSSFFSAPPAYTQFMFGPVESIKKPFRITAIEAFTDHTRRIKAIEYNESIYDFSGTAIPTPDYSDLPLEVNNVVINDVTEEIVPVANVTRAKVTVEYSSTQRNYETATVWVSTNDGPFERINTHPNFVSFERDGGDELLIRVVAKNNLGQNAVFSRATTTTYTVTGKQTGPQAPTNLIAAGFIRSVLLVWINPTDFDLGEIIIYRHTSNDRSLATEVGRVSGRQYQYTDKTASYGVTYWYWLRGVDVTGNPGEFNAVDGVSAQAATVTEDDIGAGVIGSSTLANDLTSRIDLIDQPGGLVDTVAGQTTAIQQNLNAVDGIGGKYTVKIDNNGFISGFGLISEENDGAVVSSFIVNADNFAINHPSNAGSEFVPFAVIGGQVFIQSALIQEAAIGSAQIANEIQSTNYVPGVSGWRLDKATGSLEARNITARGNIQATSLESSTLMVRKANIFSAQVDTLQIAGQAVTIPVSSYIAGIQTVVVDDDDEGYHTYDNFSVTFTSTGAPHILVCSGLMYVNANVNDATIRLRREKVGTGVALIRTMTYVNGNIGPGGAGLGSFVFNLADFNFGGTVSAATYKYYFELAIDGATNVNLNLENRFMYVVETKR